MLYDKQVSSPWITFEWSVFWYKMLISWNLCKQDTRFIMHQQIKVICNWSLKGSWDIGIMKIFSSTIMRHTKWYNCAIIHYCFRRCQLKVATQNDSMVSSDVYMRVYWLSLHKYNSIISGIIHHKLVYPVSFPCFTDPWPTTKPLMPLIDTHPPAKYLLY